MQTEMSSGRVGSRFFGDPTSTVINIYMSGRVKMSGRRVGSDRVGSQFCGPATCLQRTHQFFETLSKNFTFWLVSSDGRSDDRSYDRSFDRSPPGLRKKRF